MRFTGVHLPLVTIGVKVAPAALITSPNEMLFEEPPRWAAVVERLRRLEPEINGEAEGGKRQAE